MVSKGNVNALLSTADFQFTITRQAIQAILPLTVDIDEIYNDPIYSPVIEYKLGMAGYWQLSTPEYLVHHMGNTVPDLESELSWLNESGISETANLKPAKRSRSRLLRNRFVRQLLKRMNLITYKLLYES